jgi:hypothetical protein
VGRVDYYQLLGVSRRVSQDSLKRAFRSRLIEVHPDHNPGDALAVERTREIVEAYQVLSHPQTKKFYDMSLGDSIRPYVTPFRDVATEFPRALSRVLSFTCALVAIVYLTMTLSNLILADHSPVFRPCLDGLAVSSVQKSASHSFDSTTSECKVAFQPCYHTR